MIQNPKIDAKLELATLVTPQEEFMDTDLMVGFISANKTWRLIVKYSGDIVTACRKHFALVDILTDVYAIVVIEEDRIEAFSQEKEVDYIEKPRRFIFNIERNEIETCINAIHRYPQYRFFGEGVLIGIIDSGIDYRHPDFIDEDGKSRILYIWDQSLTVNPPKGFAIGTEYNNDQINFAISQPTYEGSMNVIPHVDLVGHGTHVAGIAAGNGNASNGAYVGAAPKASLIIVKLGVPDYEGYPINTINIMYAAKYLIDKAQELNMPIAINISYGSTYGSRDGRSIFEVYINEMARRWKSVIVASSGNEAANNLHTSGNIKENDETQFAVYENTRNVSLEIWKSQVDYFDIELISPRGTSTGIIPYQNVKLKYTIGSDNVYVIFGSSTPLSYTEAIYIELLNASIPLSEGIWTIKFHLRNVVIGDYNIWLNVSQNFGKSIFLTPQTSNTATIPSTASDVIAVGGYNSTTGNISMFSGRGSLAEADTNVTPDLVAPCENIISTAPMGGYETMSGTSMAAPFVTGSAALLMEWGIVEKNNPYLYGQNVKSILSAGARRDPVRIYPNNTWGFGKLCLLNSFELLTTGEIIQITQIDGEPPPFSPDDAIESGWIEEEGNPADDIVVNEDEIMLENPIGEDLTEEERIMSQEYVSLIVDYEENLIRIANENPNVILGYVQRDDFAVVYIRLDVVDEVINDLIVISNLSYPLLFAPLDVDAFNDAGLIPIINNPNLGLRGSGVLIAIIDSGIDYTHPAFLYEDGTSKIKLLWDQTIATGSPPEDFKYGTVYTQEQINEALKAENPLDIIPSYDETGHGTFIAGVASGRGTENYRGVAPDAELIAVKLAPARQYARENSMIFDDSKVAYQETDVILAFIFAADRAFLMNRPLVQLLSLGTNQGDHEGLWYISIVPTIRNLVFVAAAGNEGDQRKHTQFQLESSNSTYSIEFSVAEDEKGLAIYIWGYAPDKFSIGLVSPSGEIIEKVPVKNKVKDKFVMLFYPTTVWINYYIAVDRNGDPLAVLRFKNPEPGVWRINVYGESIISGKFNAWMTSSEWSSSDTFFVSSTSDSTITEIANSRDFITVGAYNHTNQNIYIRSSRGPTRRNLIKPDLLAPGVNILGPAINGGYTAKSGTSASAAIVAGAAAILLEWGNVKGNYPGINTHIVKSMLLAGARRRSDIIYPNNIYGYGQLDLLNTFKEMSNIFIEKDFNFYITSLEEKLQSLAGRPSQKP